MGTASAQETGHVRFLLIESQASAVPAGTGLCQDAAAQARLGHSVVLFLIQDGVTLALPGRAPELDTLLEAGGRVWVDGFSLAQRGLHHAGLLPSALTTDMDAVAAAVLDPAVRVVWH
ncbi:DsrE family protein [Streptomyces sp. NPDC000931]|uniref:DsrE family protein n=1 Tax=Streptomyces sp. NPDC000931 TaxID=3154372 RepID=UPI0033245659